MLVISHALFRGHGEVFQFLASLAQTGSGGIGANGTVLQIFHPFFKWCDSHFVELIHTDKDIFGKYLGRHAGDNGITLLDIHLKVVARMDAYEMVLTVIQVVVSLSDIEVENADGVDFLHLIVRFTQRDMLSDSLGNAIKNPLQIIKFAGILYLDNDDLVLTVTGLDVHTVEFIFSGQLIAFTLQNFQNSDFLTQKHGEETFKHVEVCLLA